MDTGYCAADWYYSKRGAPAAADGSPSLEQLGPLPWEELCARARAGELGPTDLVWNPQLPEWTPAAQVPGLFPAAAQTGAVRPPAAQPAPAPTAPPAYPTPRRAPILPWLIPLIALIIVGAGFGSYFGFVRDRGDDSAASTSSTAVSTGGAGTTAAGSETTSTTVIPDIGTIELTRPDLANLVTTTKWGEVPINEIGVILVDGKTRADADQIAQTLGGTIVGELEYLNLYQIRTAGVTEADLQAALDAATGTPGVELAFPNQEIFTDEEIWGVRQSPLNDPAYSGNYGKGYELIGAQKAWQYIKGSGLPLAGVKVGIVDDGLYSNQGEFNGETQIEYVDQASGELATPEQLKKSGGGTVLNPGGSHGTAVAGIIGGDPSNGGQTGIASTALGKNLTMSITNIYSGNFGQKQTVPDPNDPTQFVDTDGKSYTIGGLAGMLEQVKNDAKIINCSFGADHPDPNNALVAVAYTKFFQKMAKEHPDVTFVCAAGNETGALSKTNYFPAGAASGLPNVITVGNVMNDGGPADSSNFAGPDGEVTIAAPGHEAVTGTDANGDPITNEYEIGGKYYGGGTSMATPQVAAAAALLLSLKPDLTAEKIKSILANASQSARPGPENMGGGILAIDEAVFQVIQELKPGITKEQLENMGVIDAVATTTDSPNIYSLRAILAAVPDDGTQVEITTTGGVTVEGQTTQPIAEAGELEWPTVTVAVSDTDDDAPTLTVTRKDSGAASVISFEQIDLEGSWTGVLTITDFNVDQSTVTTAQAEEGCSMAIAAAIFDKLKGQPIPMTMDITMDTASGRGEAVMLIDIASAIASLNEGGEGDVEITAENEPQIIAFTLVGDKLTFHPEVTSGATSDMTGTVMMQGNTLVIDGTLASSGSGFSMTAVWTVSKQAE